MNEIWSGKVLWAWRVLELGTREVPRLLTICATLVGQQVVEQVAEPLRGIGRGALVKRHSEQTVRGGTMVFTNGWGGSAQSERETGGGRGQWSSTWAIIEENGWLLPGGDLLNGSAWAAGLTVDICHVIANREGVFRMRPEGSGFDIVDGCRARDISHV